MEAGQLEQAINALPPAAQAALHQHLQQQQQQLQDAQNQLQRLQVPPPAVQALTPVEDDLERQRQAVTKIGRDFEKYRNHTKDAAKFLAQFERRCALFRISGDEYKIAALTEVTTAEANDWLSDQADANLLPKHWSGTGDDPGVKEMFLQAFTPVDSDDKYRNALDRLHQTTSVDEYLQKFRPLALKINQTEEDKIHRFIKGLKEEVQGEVNKYRATHKGLNFQDVAQLAAAVDTVQYSHGKNDPRHFGQRQWGGRNPHSVAPANQSATGNDTAPMDLGAVNGTSGAQRQPRMTPETRLQHIREGLCFYCHQPGHLAINCPSKKGNGTAAPNGQRQ